MSNNNFTGVIPSLWKSHDKLIMLDFRNNTFSEGIGSLCYADTIDKPQYSLSLSHGIESFSYEISPGFFVDCVDNQTKSDCNCCSCY